MLARSICLDSLSSYSHVQKCHAEQAKILRLLAQDDNGAMLRRVYESHIKKVFRIRSVVVPLVIRYGN